jgi:hypothetical protein
MSTFYVSVSLKTTPKKFDVDENGRIYAVLMI